MLTTQKADDDLISLGKYKEQLISILKDSEDVVKITMPELDDARLGQSENFLGGDFIVTDSETGKTEQIQLPGHCFDVPFLKESDLDERAVITMETLVTKIENSHVKEVEIDIYALAHKNFIRMAPAEKEYFSARGYYGNRIDIMTAAIELAIMEQARNFGIGRLSFRSADSITEFTADNGFYGKKLAFVCSDFFMKSGKSR